MSCNYSGPGRCECGQLGIVNQKLGTKDLNPDQLVRLSHGARGRLVDKVRGNTARIEVGGHIGTHYGHDITHACFGGTWVAITHTVAQLRARNANIALFGA